LPEDEDPPGVPSVNVPSDPDDPSGPGVNLSITPGEGDPTLSANDDDEPAGGEEDEVREADPTGEGLETEQQTRALRLANATRAPVSVYLQYDASTDRDEENWYPANPNGTEANALRYEVPPGQTVAVQDSDWPINARRVRIWARGAGRQWNQFKDKDLPLVPEKAGAYPAAVPQNFCFTVR
jgi:hypothetical protein